MNLLTALAIGVLFGVGIFQLLRRNVIRSVMGLVLISNAMNLFLLSMGAYNGEAAAYVGSSVQISDPTPQALALTAIVISMGGFAFVMAMLYIISLRYKTSDSDHIQELKH